MLAYCVKNVIKELIFKGKGNFNVIVSFNKKDNGTGMTCLLLKYYNRSNPVLFMVLKGLLSQKSSKSSSPAAS